MLEFVLENSGSISWIWDSNGFRVDDEISSSNYWQTRSIPSLFLSLLCYLRYSWILRGTSFNFTSKFSKLSIELWLVVAKLISIQWSLYSSRRIRCLDFIDPTLKSMSPYYCTRGSSKLLELNDTSLLLHLIFSNRSNLKTFLQAFYKYI